MCKICLSRNIHSQHVSFAIRTIIKVTYKNIMNPYFLTKCVSYKECLEHSIQSLNIRLSTTKIQLFKKRELNFFGF